MREDMKDALQKSSALLKTYMPETITVIGSMGLLLSAQINSTRYEMLNRAYRSLDRSMRSYRNRVIQITHSNNWLKMHGYPMKRKSSYDREL